MADRPETPGELFKQAERHVGDLMLRVGKEPGLADAILVVADIITRLRSDPGFLDAISKGNGAAYLMADMTDSAATRH